ncbi:MAG: TonB-dependent receptor [Bdellovibrionota bacterium]|nr:TonB-dependent receptor [Bdellovibrionota bacterium]
MSKIHLVTLILLIAYSRVGLSQESYSTGEILIEKKEIEGPVDNFQAFKVEKISKDKIENPRYQTLADLVKDQVGLDTQVYCANCGAKRLTINGLKGEHTSILVDGLPLHSAVSSFYGVDSVPLLGLSEVQVMRGSGASLTNPEAIGGTLNLITVNPLDFENKAKVSFGVNDGFSRQSQNYNVLVGTKNDEKTLGLVLGGSFHRNETWDEDSNNIAELPQREGKSFIAKSRWTPNRSHDLSLRVGYSDLEILGGYRNPTKPTRVRPIAAGEADFVDGSVHNQFIGDPEKVTDWVDLARTEVALTHLYYIDEDTTLNLKGGYARQEQKAIYQHGFDYSHIDNSFVFDGYLEHFFNEELSLKAGLFVKDERLRSASENLFEKYPSTSALDIKKDNFDYLSTALYSGLNWIGDDIEVNLALRADRVDINWLELTNEVDEWVLAPRFIFSHSFSEHLTQRFSYGLGYRAPLTFFESGHGNQESGYEVAITELEKAHSLVYSLSYNTPTGYVTAGAHYTHLKNMAYGFEEFNQPIRYRNSEQDYDIFVADLLVGYKPKDWWLLEATFEIFEYQTAYKRRLPTAAIEKRIGLTSQIDKGRWSQRLALQVVPSRDISAYSRYGDHYVNRNQGIEPILDSSLTKKGQKAPTFATVDFSLGYKWTEKLTVNLNVLNVFDYTQTSAGDSPSTWHWHFNHAHYDGLHTWGPNAGRQFQLALDYRF